MSFKPSESISRIAAPLRSCRKKPTAWVKGLITPVRSAATVKRTWLNAPNTVFRWALGQKLIRRNPFADIEVTVPKKKRLRDTPAFHADEAATILTASMAIVDTSTAHEACKRWVPWLCAYTGPYERAGVDRNVAKLWSIHSFGKSRPQMRWPTKAIEDYKKDKGEDIRQVANAKDVASKMLAAFPALKTLEEHSDIWADLQFIESEAVIGTMLILMRKHNVPSLGMHDGIIVPRSKAELAKTILAHQYRKVVGVEPMLTVEPELPVSGVDL